MKNGNKIHFSWYILAGLILLQLLFSFGGRNNRTHGDEMAPVEQRW